YVAPAPDDTHQSWTSQTARQPQYVETTTEDDAGYTATAPRMSNFERNERQHRAEHIAGDRTLSASQRRSLIAAELGQPAPAPYVAPAAPVYAPAPVTHVRFDQYGNTFTQPAGSNVTINNKTGKPCVMNG